MILQRINLKSEQNGGVKKLKYRMLDIIILTFWDFNTNMLSLYKKPNCTRNHQLKIIVIGQIDHERFM